MRTLVVDDSQAMRRIVRSALEGMGYSPVSILEATDGLDALQMLRQPQFKADIVIADWNMPNMDGMLLLERLQASEDLSAIPFIMVAGEAERSRVFEAIRAGADYCIVRPFTPEALREKVLGIEKQLLAQSKPTDTAIFRFEAANASPAPDTDIPFMAQLPENLVTRIRESASRSECAPGKILVAPGDIVQCLHVVDSGVVEILTSNGGSSCFRGRGDCFGELSFLSGDAAVLGVRAKTKVSVESVVKADFDEILAEHPSLSGHMTRLLAKRARNADARLSSELDRGLSGRLSTMGLPDLVQTLYNSGKTGLLRVENGSEKGEIYFVEGRVRHASLDAQKGLPTGQMGETAFCELLAWTEGMFSFEAGTRRIEHGIFRATMGLLIEGMRRQDELRWLGV